MYSFSELYKNSLTKVTKSVDLNVMKRSTDGTEYREGSPDPAVYKMIPLNQYLTAKMAIAKFRSKKPILGSVVAIDQEIPQDRDYAELTIENIGSFKIGKSRVFTEKDYNDLQDIRMLASTPGMASAANEQLNAYMATPVALSDAILFKLFMLTMRVLTLGECRYVDPKTKLAVDLSYTSQIPAGHMAPTKTGGGRWSQAGTATGIQDIADHLAVYYATLQRYPEAILMNSNTFTQLRNQSSTKEMVLRDKGILTTLDATNAAALGAVKPGSVEDISSAIGDRLTTTTGQPGSIKIIVTDGKFYERGLDGTTTEAQYLPSDYYVFWSSGCIEQAILPNAANDFAGGLATSTHILSPDPKRESVIVSGVVVPIVPDPRYLGARNVNDTAI